MLAPRHVRRRTIPMALPALFGTSASAYRAFVSGIGGRRLRAHYAAATAATHGIQCRISRKRRGHFTKWRQQLKNVDIPSVLLCSGYASLQAGNVLHMFTRHEITATAYALGFKFGYGFTAHPAVLFVFDNSYFGANRRKIGEGFTAGGEIFAGYQETDKCTEALSPLLCVMFRFVEHGNRCGSVADNQGVRFTVFPRRIRKSVRFHSVYSCAVMFSASHLFGAYPLCRSYSVPGLWLP